MDVTYLWPPRLSGSYHPRFRLPCYVDGYTPAPEPQTDDCYDEPCGDFGTCEDTGLNSYSCRCDDGYTFSGETCEEILPCSSQELNDCDVAARATCMHINPGQHTCTCAAGYSGDGTSCADTNGCAESPCFSDAACHDQPAPTTGFSCDPCPDGFSGDGQTCSDIDDCVGGPCGGGTCSDTGANSYSCLCNEGYTFSGDTCVEIFPCETGELNTCDTNAVCNHDGPGLHSCACNAGYSGDGTSCADTDGCAESPCFGETVTCSDIDAPGTGFTCGPCPSGYFGDGTACNQCTAVDNSLHDVTCDAIGSSRVVSCIQYHHKVNAGSSAVSDICEPNVCTCDSGSPVDTSICDAHLSEQCASCHAGYQLSDGVCAQVVCPQEFVGSFVTDCHCHSGFSGTVRPSTVAPYYTTSCLQVSCPGVSEGDDVGSGCACPVGTTGAITATSTAPYYDGVCEGIPCPANSQGVDVRAGCECDSGYYGADDSCEECDAVADAVSVTCATAGNSVVVQCAAYFHPVATEGSSWNRCWQNECTCSHGEPIDDCETHESENCSECVDPGYKLEQGVCTKVTCPAAYVGAFVVSGCTCQPGMAGGVEATSEPPYYTGVTQN
jgi:hypothetical protein